MKLEYITPATEVVELNTLYGMMTVGSVEGIDGDTGIGLGGEEDDEHQEGDVKEFTFEEDPWECGSNDNYWE